jgi:cytochrome P450
VHWQEECKIPVFMQGPGYFALTGYYDVAFVSKHPEVSDDPEVFDITRKPNSRVAFGVGTHFCMGSHIARLEMRVTLEEFLGRFSKVSLAGPPERLQSNFISGIKRLPVNLL